MKDEDYKLATDILNEVKQFHSVQESTLLERMEANYGKKNDFRFNQQSVFLLRELVTLELLSIENNRYTLTKEGHVAASIGVGKYLERYTEKKELPRKQQISIILTIVSALFLQ